MKRHNLFRFALATLLIVLFLFFIDEGYYNFNWVRSSGNWIAFLLYFIGIFGSQLVFHKLILPVFGLHNTIILSILLGSAAGISLMIFILFRS